MTTQVLHFVELSRDDRRRISALRDLGRAGKLELRVKASEDGRRAVPLPPDAAGALVALGDMPGIRAPDIDLMVAAFMRARGAAIVRATQRGKRGNPVILPAALFGPAAALDGDVGARHLVETSGIEIVDVEIGPRASLDVDTPQALKTARKMLGR